MAPFEVEAQMGSSLSWTGRGPYSPHSTDVCFSFHSIVPDIAVGTKVGVSSLAFTPSLPPQPMRGQDSLVGVGGWSGGFGFVLLWFCLVVCSRQLSSRFRPLGTWCCPCGFDLKGRL